MTSSITLTRLIDVDDARTVAVSLPYLITRLSFLQLCRRARQSEWDPAHDQVSRVCFVNAPVLFLQNMLALCHLCAFAPARREMIRLCTGYRGLLQ